jgi:hypothetical protein
MLQGFNGFMFLALTARRISLVWLCGNGSPGIGNATFAALSCTNRADTLSCANVATGSSSFFANST